MAAVYHSCSADQTWLFRCSLTTPRPPSRNNNYIRFFYLKGFTFYQENRISKYPMLSVVLLVGMVFAWLISIEFIVTGL